MRDELEVRAVEMAGEGRSVREIAEALGRSRDDVRMLLKDVASDHRRRAAEVADERALVADARIEWLLWKLQEMIRGDTVAGTPVFDDRKWKVMIQLLERQARLHGYDREKTAAANDPKDWFATHGEQKLREYAKSLGVTLPETFGAES